jgi:hypothetical protein
MKYLKRFNENFGQKGMFGLIVNDKKVKDFSKNEDSSFNVEFEDSTKTIIYVSHDDWDKLNDSMLKE